MKRRRLLLLSTVILLLVVLSTVAFASNGGSFFFGLDDIAMFFKNIFVPAPNYFHNKLSVLYKRLYDRLGGLAYLYLMLHYFFKTLENVPSASMVISIPNNFFFTGYKGFSLDLFTSAQPYIRMLRSVLTVSVCLATAIACYHKFRTLFRE